VPPIVNTRVSVSLQRLVANVSVIHQDRLIQTLTIKIKGQPHHMNPVSDKFVVRVAGCRDELTWYHYSTGVKPLYHGLSHL